MSYNLEIIETRLKEIIEQEKLELKLDEETFMLSLTFFRNILNKILQPKIEPKSNNNLTQDIDKIIVDNIKKDQKKQEYLKSKLIPIYFLLKIGLPEILGIKDEYYLLREEVLKHSKLLSSSIDSPDFLLLNMEEYEWIK